MDDKTLVELAAKAAGIKRLTKDGPLMCLKEHAMAEWMPLIDDGDALRLAVALRLTMIPDKLVCEVGCSYGPGPVKRERVTASQDRYGAMRRAIVRAAAAIAEQQSQGDV